MPSWSAQKPPTGAEEHSASPAARARAFLLRLLGQRPPVSDESSQPDPGAEERDDA